MWLLKYIITKGSIWPVVALATLFQPHGGNQENRWFSLLLNPSKFSGEEKKPRIDNPKRRCWLDEALEVVSRTPTS